MRTQTKKNIGLKFGGGFELRTHDPPRPGTKAQPAALHRRQMCHHLEAVINVGCLRFHLRKHQKFKIYIEKILPVPGFPYKDNKPFCVFSRFKWFWLFDSEFNFHSSKNSQKRKIEGRVKTKQTIANTYIFKFYFECVWNTRWWVFNISFILTIIHTIFLKEDTQ